MEAVFWMRALEDYLSSLEKRVENAEKDISGELSESLQNLALASGWPVNVANKLHVTYENGHYVPAYPPNIATKVHDLEYGVTDEPSPVLRRFLNRSDVMADKRYAKKLSGLL